MKSNLVPKVSLTCLLHFGHVSPSVRGPSSVLTGCGHTVSRPSLAFKRSLSCHSGHLSFSVNACETWVVMKEGHCKWEVAWVLTLLLYWGGLILTLIAALIPGLKPLSSLSRIETLHFSKWWTAQSCFEGLLCCTTQVLASSSESQTLVF